MLTLLETAQEAPASKQVAYPHDIVLIEEGVVPPKFLSDLRGQPLLNYAINPQPPSGR
jgi:hypothetical protein